MSDEKQETLLILELDLSEPEDLWKAVEKIAALDIPLVVGGNHIAIDDLARSIKKLLAPGNIDD